MAEPKKPTTMIGVHLPNSVLASLDAARGQVPRSRFVRSLIEAHIRDHAPAERIGVGDDLKQAFALEADDMLGPHLGMIDSDEGDR